MINFFKKLFSVEGKEKDPVCGMFVDPKTAKHTFAFQGKAYYFCSESCYQSFKKDPENYV